MRLVTARATLRPLGPTDVDVLHELWSDPEVQRRLYDGVVSTAQSHEWLTTSAGNFVARGFGLWGVMVDEVTLAGFAGCQRWPASDEPELMYGLRPTWWGRGLATEACQAVVAHVFERLGHPMIVGATDPFNRASIAVLDRLGFTFAGAVDVDGRESRVYRLSRERWRRRHDRGSPLSTPAVE